DENEPVAEAAETAVQEEQYQEPVPARRPTEEIDVAAILRQAEAERQQELQAAHHTPQSRYSISGAPGTVEEEEIEEEEQEHPGFMQEVDDAEFDELEEETLGESAGVDELGEHSVESQTEESPAAELEDGDPEGDLEEFTHADADSAQAEAEAHVAEAEQAHEAAEQAQGTNGRAEVRGPSGIQQK